MPLFVCTSAVERTLAMGGRGMTLHTFVCVARDAEAASLLAKDDVDQRFPTGKVLTATLSRVDDAAIDAVLAERWQPWPEGADVFQFPREFVVADAYEARWGRAFFFAGELVIIGAQWKPTHWMPEPRLPAAPAQDNGQDGERQRS